MSLPDILDALPQHPAITWVPFHVAHYATMRVSSQNLQAVSRVLPIDKMLEAQAMSGEEVTAILHGRPAAVLSKNANGTNAQTIDA